MQLKQTENTEIVIGGGKERMFSIDDSNDVIFSILRDKMYSNKIGAVCREVASNSRDANREAGLATMNSEIEFTDSDAMYGLGDTCIVFRDFGIGITPDRMENVFMKYAASTKRSSNSQTGGFGLGAKTPFAYTDSFIIKTVCDVDGKRMEYVYNAIIDKTGKGKMIDLSEAETTANTGTEIIIPVLTNEDRYNFEKECYYATMFWGTVNYINFNSEVEELNVVVQGEGFRVVKNLNSTSFNSNYIGLLDGIPYPIYPTVHQRGLDSNFRILMDIDFSKVTINANRESIQNDKETIDYVDAQVKKVNSQLEKIVEEYLADNTDLKEAVKKHLILNKKRSFNSSNAFSPLDEIIYNRKGDASSIHLLSDLKATVYFEGQKISDILKFNGFFFEEVKVCNLQTSGEDFINCSTQYDGKMDFYNLIDQEKIYLMDKGRISLIKNYQITKNGNSNKFILLKKNVTAVNTEIEEDLKLIEKLGIEIVNYSEVEVTVKKVSAASVRAASVRIIVRVNGYSQTKYWKFNTITKQLFDNLDKEVDKSKIAFLPVNSINDKVGWSYDDKISLIGLNNTLEFFKINTKSFEKHLQPQGFNTVEDVFKKIDLKKFEKVLDYKEICYIFDSGIPKILLSDFSECLPKSLTDLEKTKAELEKLFEKVPKHKITNISWERFGIKKSKFDYYGLMEKYRKVMKQKYPMLRPYLNSVNIDNPTERETIIKTIKNYIACHY